MGRAATVRGWVDVDLFDVWCLACAATADDARRLAGAVEDAGRVLPVGEDWAEREHLTCTQCGRAL